jgi:hypothetical protein
MSQLFEEGKVINVDGVDLECVGVGYQDDGNTRTAYHYTFRPKADVDAERLEREEREKRMAEQEAEQAAANPESSVEPEVVTEPEVNKEETLNVK